MTAIDPETGIEVSIVGDPSAGEKHLSDLAVRKLRFVLDRKDEKRGTSGKGPGVVA